MEILYPEKAEGEYSYNRYFAYDSAHQVICYLLAVDGQALPVLRPIDGYLEGFDAFSYEDMEVLEFDSETGERFMTVTEVFERLQINSQTLLTDPGILASYLTVGNQYKVILEEKDGYYQFVEVTKQ